MSRTTLSPSWSSSLTTWWPLTASLPACPALRIPMQWTCRRAPSPAATTCRTCRVTSSPPSSASATGAARGQAGAAGSGRCVEARSGAGRRPRTTSCWSRGTQTAAAASGTPQTPTCATSTGSELRSCSRRTRLSL